jgi:protein-disulfide isomerase
MKKKSWIILSAVVVVLAGAAVVAYNMGAFDSLPDSAGAMQPIQPAMTAAQTTPPAPVANNGYPFKDTSMLKPPTGAKVAIFEFEDLECPACAHAFPLVRAAVERHHVALVRHDFPLTEIHIWSFDAAVTARYIQDTISPKLAETFRGDVFASQSRINSKEDLDRFTRSWFLAHGQAMPFVIDPSGACRNEVKSDRALGDQLGIHSTPCILVVTQNSYVQVMDMSQLDHMIDQAEAQTTSQTEPPPVALLTPGLARA